MAQLQKIRVAPVTPTDAFFGAAESFLEGVRVLITAQRVPSLPLTLIAGHTLECALKAYLAKAGLSDKKLSKAPFGHDIIRLWQEARANGLTLPHPMPDWVEHLARVYSSPFVARYPMGVHALVLPNMTALARGVEQVVQGVRAAIR